MLGMKLGRPSLVPRHLGAMFERMSDRERKIVLGGGGLVTLALILLVGVLVSRRVSALEEDVTAGEVALREVAATAPDYLRVRAEEKALGEQLDRASKESLQATVLAIAKDIKYEKTDAEGNATTERLADVIKFANSSEILAELTSKTKKAKKKPKKKGGQEVFLATIDAVFAGVPDEALMRFLSKLETHPDPLFGLALDISRTQTTRDQFQATLKIGQFRYGTLED